MTYRRTQDRRAADYSAARGQAMRIINALVTIGVLFLLLLTLSAVLAAPPVDCSNTLAATTIASTEYGESEAVNGFPTNARHWAWKPTAR
jgi:hypothetical protein